MAKLYRGRQATSESVCPPGHYQPFPPSAAHPGSNCYKIGGVGETVAEGKALGWAVFVGIGLLAATMFWLGTRGE